MDEVPPAMLAGLMRATDGLGEAGAYLRDIFGPFTFDGIEPVPPTTTFDGELDLQVGDRTVRLLELGPAHTRGDVVVHVPDADVLFTGDLVFHGGHPIVWAGPGGPLDRGLRPHAGARRHHGRARPRPARATAPASRTSAATSSGSSPRARPGSRAAWRPLDAARDLAGGPYDGWGERERLVVNLTALARDLGQEPAADVLTLFGGMATLAAASAPSCASSGISRERGQPVGRDRAPVEALARGLVGRRRRSRRAGTGPSG